MGVMRLIETNPGLSRRGTTCAGTFVQCRAFSYHLIFSCIRLDKAEVAGSSPASPTTGSWREGLLEFRPGHGITVTGAAPKRSAVIERAQELVQFARREGYRRDELLKLIESLPSGAG
jgi:hypothetical protein